MILHVQAAKHLHDYVLWVRFSDGTEGEVDLSDELDGEVFGPLKRPSLFRALRVDPVLKTVVWPNMADLAPEFLRSRMRLCHPATRSRDQHAPVMAAREPPVPYMTGAKTGRGPAITRRVPPRDRRRR